MFIQQPPSFTHLQLPPHVCCLHKDFYDLKQAPCAYIACLPSRVGFLLLQVWFFHVYPWLHLLHSDICWWYLSSLNCSNLPTIDSFIYLLSKIWAIYIIYLVWKFYLFPAIRYFHSSDTFQTFFTRFTWLMQSQLPLLWVILTHSHGLLMTHSLTQHFTEALFGLFNISHSSNWISPLLWTRYVNSCIAHYSSLNYCETNFPTSRPPFTMVFFAIAPV